MSEIVTGTFAGPKTERVLVDELHDDYIRDLRIKGRVMLRKMISKWNLHLKPVFGGMRAIDVTTDHITRYVDDRQREKTRTGKKVANATICRELEGLKRMFKIGYQATPPKFHRIPTFPAWPRTMFGRGFSMKASSTRWWKAMNSGSTDSWSVGGATAGVPTNFLKLSWSKLTSRTA